jgi:hypothetical protein
LTGRERCKALINGKPTDRLVWTTLVDDHTLNILPDELRGMTAFDFYRYIRCEILQLNGWGSDWDILGSELVMPGVEEVTETDAEGNTTTTSRCPRGTLTSQRSHNVHPIEYPVKTIEDMRILAGRWEDAYYKPVDDRANFELIEKRVGDDGVTVSFIGPSAIPQLLEQTMGMQQFYYLMADYPEEMDALIKLIQQKELSCFELSAQTPCDAVILCENTSTRYISPKIYEKYNMPSQRSFIEACHRHGKKGILHMCGHVYDLLEIIKETGTDGIHALTPPPTGDCHWEKALDVLGDDLIIMGVLTPDIFHQYPLDEIGPAIDKQVTPRVRESNFILMPCCDGTATPLERFLTVRDWLESKG